LPTTPAAAEWCVVAPGATIFSSALQQASAERRRTGRQ
jgi:hypothetical protein